MALAKRCRRAHLVSDRGVSEDFMRRFAFIAPLAVALSVAGLAQAQPDLQPAARAPEVVVALGPDVVKEIDTLGQREVLQQVDQLGAAVRRELARSGALEGAEVYLTITDLKPNRPTFQQTIDRPGLSVFDSVSIGGATIEGEIVTADGERLPVRYSRYSSSIRDVIGYAVWQDAGNAYRRLASNLSNGRLVSR